MRVLCPTRLAMLRLRTLNAQQQRVRLLARAFSDAVDPFKTPLGSSLASLEVERSEPYVNGSNNNGYNGSTTNRNRLEPEQLQFLTSYDDQEEQLHDVEFTTQRIGFPISESEAKERAAFQLDSADDDEIREESREEASVKAERIMAVLRHSMSELEIGKVIQRIAQYATLPRVTGLSRKQFLRSLETRFGGHKKEFSYMLAFLQGRDDVIEQLEINSRQGAEDDFEEDDFVVPMMEDEETMLESMDEDFVVPTIMGLHPDLVADPQFVSIVFCYCRLACLNSLKLMKRNVPGYSRGSKSSLWQVKADFRKVLDMEGYSHYADMLGLETPTKTMADEDMDAVDAEWEEFNLENDRIDFRMLVSQTQDSVAFMKRELSNETISKMLVAMLASVKTSKLHRKIFQEMVCNIQTAFPDTYHEQLLSELVPFLSGGNATYRDFDSETAANALQHHQMRNEAIIRSLMESRMRVGHILIHDIDEVEPIQSVSNKLSDDVHEKVITTAWNIVSVLNDRKYHMFFTRFLKYKLAWRPNRTTFGETFLADVRKILGPRNADAIMPLFEEVYQQLSVETLTICRVKLRHSGKLLRGRGALVPLNEAGRERIDTAWQSSHCAFYRNLPFGVKDHHLKTALGHVGGVKRFLLFANPINGDPDKDSFDNDTDNDEENEHADGGNDEGKKKQKKKKSKNGKKDKVETSLPSHDQPKKKDKVIASDPKTQFQAVVEFESESECKKATMRAMQIFGVMMAGWREYRSVFSTPADSRSSITLMNIPYGTAVGAVVNEVNEVLSAAGLNMKVSGLVPTGVMLTNGRLDLRFPSFVEAAQVVDLLHEHVKDMKPRRTPSKLEAEQNTEYKRLKIAIEEGAKKAEKADKEKSAAKGLEVLTSEEESEEDEDEEEVRLTFGVDEDDDDDNDDNDTKDNGDDINDDDDGKEKKKVVKRVMEVKESPEKYFADDLVKDVLAKEYSTEEQKARRKQLRPFDVTWTPLPKPKNKHMYL